MEGHDRGRYRISRGRIYRSRRFYSHICGAARTPFSQLHHSSLCPDFPAADNMAEPSTLRAVQVEALVVMKVIKHSTQTFPTTATGSLVGMDKDGILEVTNCFPFPTVDIPQDGHQEVRDLTAAAPRAKANTGYQNEMIKMLREVNIDAANVGWYTSTSMGAFVNLNTIENQFFYQKELNERTIALVHDVSRSSQGSLSLRAFRLSPAFMAAYREGKFTVESYVILHYV